LRRAWPVWVRAGMAFGTAIEGVEVRNVSSSNHLKVVLPGEDHQRVVRLVSCSAEYAEDQHGSGLTSRMGTPEGKKATKWLRDLFGAEHDGRFSTERGPAIVDLEFEGDEPADECLVKYRDARGHLLCNVWLSTKAEPESWLKDTHVNVTMVRAGHSPYFNKYGRSRHHHHAFLDAEREAMAEAAGIWDRRVWVHPGPDPYVPLAAWWGFRDALIHDHRRFMASALATRLRYPVKDARGDYEELCEAGGATPKHLTAPTSTFTVFVDLGPKDDTLGYGGVMRAVGSNDACLYAGDRRHRFNLWVPNRDSEEALKILDLVERRYAGAGKRNYCYVTGAVQVYKPKRRPQITLTDAGQITDYPPLVPRIERSAPSAVTA